MNGIMPSRLCTETNRAHNSFMNEHHDDRLHRYLELCQRIFERMEREGKWPWTGQVDLTDFEDVLESEFNPDDV